MPPRVPPTASVQCADVIGGCFLRNGPLRGRTRYAKSIRTGGGVEGQFAEIGFSAALWQSERGRRSADGG